jgi:SNF2 family DNA or RNA helicase
VLADEQGLGKSASVLAFLQSLRADFACPGPVLLVAPAASLPFWEGAPAAS